MMGPRHHGVSFPACIGGRGEDILAAIDSFALAGTDQTPAYPKFVPIWTTLTPGSRNRRVGIPSARLMDEYDARGVSHMVFLESAPTREAYLRLDDLPPLRREERTIYFRMDHEMNGLWAPWSVKPSLYIERWRRYHGHILKYVPNALFVWVPQGAHRRADLRREFREWYPGHEFVDFTGFDKYDLGNRSPLTTAWRAPIEELKTLAPEKRIIVGEYGALSIPPNAGLQARDRWLRSIRYVDRVWAAIYFNINMATMGHPTDKRDWTMTPRMERIMRSNIYATR